MLATQKRLERSRLEYSVHQPSRLLRTDIELVFRPDVDVRPATRPLSRTCSADECAAPQAEFKRQRPGALAEAKDDWFHEVLLAIPTWQQAARDLSEISDAVSNTRPLLKPRDRGDHRNPSTLRSTKSGAC